jgi:hypothetical protein
VLWLALLAPIVWLGLFHWATSRLYAYQIDVHARSDGTPVVLRETGLCVFDYKVLGWARHHLLILTSMPTGTPGERAFLASVPPVCGPSLLRAALDWGFFARDADLDPETIWVALSHPGQAAKTLMSPEDPSLVVIRATRTRLPGPSRVALGNHRRLPDRLLTPTARPPSLSRPGRWGRPWQAVSRAVSPCFTSHRSIVADTPC